MAVSVCPSCAVPLTDSESVGVMSTTAAVAALVALAPLPSASVEVALGDVPGALLALLVVEELGVVPEPLLLAGGQCRDLLQPERLLVAGGGQTPPKLAAAAKETGSLMPPNQSRSAPVPAQTPVCLA